MSGTADEGDARLVEGCWRYALEVRGADRALRLVHEARASEVSRANDRVDDLVSTAGPRALPLLVRLALSAPDEESLAFFAAGPLEEWMERAGGEDLARAAEAARRQPRFRAATEGVWLSAPRRWLWERLTVGRP